MHAQASLHATSVVRPGYDPDAAATARRVLPKLSSEPVVWLSTVRPDGAPHLVPTWFLWDGEALLVWSKPNAVKVRNLRANPRLMVAVGDPQADFDVGLIEASATLGEPGSAAIPDAFFAKYAVELAAAGLDAERFRAIYSQAVRVVPTRFLAWHGRASAGPRQAAVTAEVNIPRGPRLADRVAGWLDAVADRLRGSAHVGRSLPDPA